MIRRATVASAALALACLELGCSLGEGQGSVKSEDLFAPDCWLHNSYDLQPDFFAAVPYRDTLQIRVQRGNDLQEVSDGLSLLIDDVKKIREEKLGKPLCVSIPVGVIPPGALPTEPDPVVDAACGGEYLVHAALYLHASCHNQNTVLYALSGFVQFDSLFSGDPNEKDADEKYTNASFDELTIGDPHDAPSGASADQIPTDKQSKLKGTLSFYFERGQPGQPFP